MLKLLDETRAYMKKNATFSSPTARRMLQFFEMEAGNPTHPLSDKESAWMEKSGFGLLAQTENLHQLMIKRQYALALSKLDPVKVKDSETLDNLALFDLLSLLVKGREVTELGCLPIYEKYKESYAYSVLTCGILKEFKKSGRLDEKEMARLESFFQNHDQQMKFLLAVISDLK